MHFEILVEGQTELTVLSILMSKIVGPYEEPHTWKIHKHRGVGRLPDDPAAPPNPRDTTLLHQLPAKLRAYSKSPNPDRIVLVLLDLDDRELPSFEAELNDLLSHCENDFHAEFKFAVEELEAWYLGDRLALLLFNPDIRVDVLDRYEQDSICGTWEVLAAADEPSILNESKRGPQVLNKKKEWSKQIPVLMNIDDNLSDSFNGFLEFLRSSISANC